MWPNARISVMGGEQAARVLLQVKMEQKPMAPEAQKEFMRPILEKYESEGNAYYSTARIWDDGVIDPADTRTVLALGISAAMNKPADETKFGVFRM
jgi:acetyl-CoA carboxylase carboxyltransferase component